MPTNQELRERHRRVTPSWLAVYHDEPIAIDRGEGRTVWDVEGNEYLDFFGGILTTMIGHNVPEITHAVQEQAAKLHAQFDAVPQRADDRAGRDDRRAVRDPRRQGVLHHVGHRGQRRRPAAGDDLPQVEPGPGAAQQLPRPVVHGDRHHQPPLLVADAASAG